MNKVYLCFLVLIAYSSCKSGYKANRIVYQSVSVEEAADADLSLLIKPYKDSVYSTMDVVIGTVETAMHKNQPEGTLGNFLTDALLQMARLKMGRDVDAAFVNPGGIRVPMVNKGNITVGKIFEIMPFDNVAVVQEVSGEVLQLFLDYTAARGGWPVAGLTMKIEDGKAVDVLIGGRPIDFKSTYSILNSDYIVSGGDNCEVLKEIPVYTNGYLIRDALIDYTRLLTTQNRTIHTQIENRVRNVD